MSSQCSAAAGTRGQGDSLAPGERVKVNVTVMGTRLFTHLGFELTCPTDSRKSSSIMIWRLSPTDKTIRWSAFWDGNAPPSDPNLPSEDGGGPYPEQEFPGGEHTFVVERRPAAGGVPDHMALWLQERPDRVARVRVQEGCDRLRTTTFIGSISPKFYNSGGVCGHQGMVLPPGSKVRVGVDVQSTDLGFQLVMRRPQDAAEASSAVAVTGIADDRRAWGYLARGPDGQVVSSAYLPSYRDPFGQPQLTPRLPDGEHVFVVERRPAEMAVWLEARPNLVVTAPVLQGEPLHLELHAALNRVLYDKA
ncbi:uncharacterized protein LOC117643258 isoform X2 [Thrips palmi]|nr:uncharacterized protein LOC117643258 isoform X2 [Thrips palmi]XP_034237920.1 uncharacterized protein LOC117643258 isoform X2 [Thrips palmi]